MRHPEMTWEKAAEKAINQKPGMRMFQLVDEVSKMVFLSPRYGKTEFCRWFNETEDRKYMLVMDDNGEVYIYPKNQHGMEFCFNHENGKEIFCKPEHKDSILYQLSLEK